MTITVKNKTDLVVPLSVRRQAGIKSGDRLEFRVSGGIINIIPEVPAADEYTPAQREAIDARLATAGDGPHHGPHHGPFDTAEDAIRFLKREIRKRNAGTKHGLPH